jgi:uncharacterized protein
MNRFLIIVLTTFLAGSIPARADDQGMLLVNSARLQIGKTVSYDPAYRSMSYPNGDVPIKTGVCSDVIVRAFRAGLGLDLQELVHEDMKQNFHLYPNNWGLRSTDRNIDHRRVLNLRTFFERKGWAVRASENPADYKPGDILICIVPPNLPHIMIVSDRKTLLSRP